jgi:hypothetical protein
MGSSTWGLRSATSSSSSSSSPKMKVSWSLTSPLRFTIGFLGAEPDPEAEAEARRLTPAKHARHGSYLASRGLEAMHEGQIGRWQQFVVNKREISDLEGGKDEEQARHKLLLFTDMIKAVKRPKASIIDHLNSKVCSEFRVSSTVEIWART